MGSCTVSISLAFVETEDERFILERQDPLERREYVRFVVGHRDEDSHVEQGIYQAVARALGWQNITGSDADELNELRNERQYCDPGNRKNGLSKTSKATLTSSTAPKIRGFASI